MMKKYFVSYNNLCVVVWKLMFFFPDQLFCKNILKIFVQHKRTRFLHVKKTRKRPRILIFGYYSPLP